MYIPKTNEFTDQSEAIKFMKEFSFATIVTVKDNVPIATHLPFIVESKEDRLVLTSHFAKANDQWEDLRTQRILTIFTEPHAYISPTNYEKELNVPTWNYISVHAYGLGELIDDPNEVFEVLEKTIQRYENSYMSQWNALPDDYKQKMSKGITAFEIHVDELQAKKKLSQNKTFKERENIVKSLSKSNHSNERLIASYMNKGHI
ncbi:MAG: FMN-binding negative transcriptional regulator [Ekhidna sp.]|nr:FMN-binding negative transcriptional regulator [Ekhidna sp.]